MIKIENLSKNYKLREILLNANAEFEKGKVNFILASNGSGKTTLFKCILGLETYNGKIIFDKPLQKIFCVFDNPPFYNKLSGYKNLKLFAHMYSIKDFKINNYVLSEEKLRLKVSTYSYGQRKKLALMLIDIIKPDIILMDEISNGLDYETIIYLKQKIKDLSKDKLLILTGHQLEVYDNLVEKTYIIKDKKLIYIDSSESLGEVYEKYITKCNL